MSADVSRATPCDCQVCRAAREALVHGQRQAAIAANRVRLLNLFRRSD